MIALPVLLAIALTGCSQSSGETEPNAASTQIDSKAFAEKLKADAEAAAAKAAPDQAKANESAAAEEASDEAEVAAVKAAAEQALVHKKTK